jgi:hypothetical protein
MGAVCPLAAHHGAESCLLGAVTAIASIAGMMLRCGNEVKGQEETFWSPICCDARAFHVKFNRKLPAGGAEVL